MNFKRLLSKPLNRYILVGGSVYVVEILVIIVAQFMGFSAVVAVGMSFWVGLVLSFCLQKVVTYKDKRLHHKILVSQILAFTLLVIFNFVFTIVVTKLLYPHLPAIITRSLALLVTTLWNYYLYRTQIFKTDENPVY